MKIVFVGGGNMASALIGGLLATADNGISASDLTVVDPSEQQRIKLLRTFGVVCVATLAQTTPADVVVWAVKPQQFKDAAQSAPQALVGALQLSVMAGVRSTDIARLSGSPRVVRAMPNTPALIGKGIAGIYANAACGEQDKRLCELMLKPTGDTLWLDHEEQLDAVTALSGSGPAYVFYFVEAMMQAAVQMGLSEQQGKQLAIATFSGAAELARRSSDAPAVLRERVTSKGGTTHAALTELESAGVKAAFVAALRAAQKRAQELGDELT
jgi:pyrroline-5-carboxylate reductase